MDAGRIDLNLLLVLQAVGQERNVTRAARRLGLSQPAVSSAVARLRQALGDPLFVRSSGGMAPTPRARRLLESVDAAMGLIRQGLQEGESFDSAQSRTSFTLLASEIGERHFLPSLMARLRRTAPHVRVQVRQVSGGSYGAALETGLADLLIGHLSQPLSSLRSRRLFSDRFVCMVRQGHPVLDQPLTLERYLALDHVVITRRGARDGMVTAALARLGGERRVAIAVPHFTAAPAIVAATDLAATVPAQLVRLHAEGEVAGVALPFDVPPIDVGLYWHERLQGDAANQWLRRTFVELFAASSQDPGHDPDGRPRHAAACPSIA